MEVSKIHFIARIVSVITTILKMFYNFIVWSISYLMAKSSASIELIFMV